MTDPAHAGFFEGVFDRTLTNLRSAWREIAESARGVLAGVPRSEVSGDDADRLRQQMLSCLDGRGGEVTARAIYIRFHGSGAPGGGSYDDAALRSWADRIRAWLDRQHDVYVYFNNDACAVAIRDAAALRDMVG